MKKPPSQTRWNGVLVETCLESGSMSEKAIKEALAGKKHREEMKAVVSLIEHFIGTAHYNARNAKDARSRDEDCGAAGYLCDLRAKLMDLTQKETEEEEKSRPGD